MKYGAFVVVGLCAAILSSQPAGPQRVGRQPDGSFLLSTGWRIQPAGAQIPLDTLPMSSAVSRDGKFVLVLNAGYKPPTISVIGTGDMKEISRVPVADAWLGLAFSPNGQNVYVGGGAHGSIYEFAFSPAGELRPTREFAVAGEGAGGNFIGDVAVSPDGRLIYAAEMYHDSIAVINPQSGRVIDHFKTGRRPYRILFRPDGKAFFVSSWADGTVYLHNITNGAEIGRVRLGPHTTDMVLSNRKPEVDKDAGDTVDWTYRLFVAASNTNNVFVVSVNDSNTLKLIESVNVALTTRHPLGMTPSGLALNPDQTRLFVACSDANVVAATDISEARSRVAGFIPTGWYPTSARVLADGRLLVLNGRGGGSSPSRYRGPDVPKGSENNPRSEYIAERQTGTMSVIDSPTDDALENYTRLAQSLSPYRDSQLDVLNTADDNPIYSKPGRPSPIEHVVYIVKENRTYDQVLGKIGKGNSDPSLTLFDESAAPNHYKLARDFVLFDNFYVNADVSADGHNWAMASIAPDYTQKLWPSNYSGRDKRYDFEGGEPANTPPAGYLWSNALAAGLSFRNYGEWVQNKAKPGADGVQIERVMDPALLPVTNLRYRSFDTDYPDVDRAGVFLADLQQFESTGTMPRLLVVRLGNDHTSGASPGKIAPLSAFADNDYALGMIVEGLSRSRFWAKTAVFVIEDDAQDGPDHVDSHRSVLFVASPYTRHGIVDSSMYNQSSVLRTMELILGMRPLTHYDAAGRPISAPFAGSPVNTPYVAEKPRISLTQRNPGGTTLAARSARMDFSEADRGDDDELNDILWQAIRRSDPPPPVRSYFSRR